MAGSFEWVGYVAGLCTTLAFAPQVVKTLRRRSASDISTGMYVLMVTGTVLWLWHGIDIGSWPVITANAVTLVLVVAMLVMALRYK